MALQNNINAPTPISVPNGGTAVSALTAYMPMVGGTTTTGAVQSVATGTIGQSLTYVTSGQLPRFESYGIISIFGYGGGAGYPATGLFNTLTSNTNFTITTGRIYLMPFVPWQTHTFTGITLYLITGVGASNIAMGMYDASFNLLTGTSSGSIASTGSGVQLSYTFSTPQTLTGGQAYYAAFAGSSSSLVIGGQAAGTLFPMAGPTNPTNASAQIGSFYTTAYSGTFPNPAGASGGLFSNGTWPLIYLIG